MRGVEKRKLLQNNGRHQNLKFMDQEKCDANSFKMGWNEFSFLTFRFWSEIVSWNRERNNWVKTRSKFHCGC